MIQVLNKGYVRYIDHLGTDLSVVNAARASFKKESDWEYSEEMVDQSRILEFVPRLKEADRKLINYLAKHNHGSPFRHCYVTLEIKAPIIIARQIFKHVIGVASIEEGTNWNEASYRYVTAEPEFYIPSSWRSAPENKKQGSGEPVGEELTENLNALLHSTIKMCMDRYELAVKHGVCIEQARGFLPANFQYTTWRWTASLQAIAHFCNLRLGKDAQSETTEYAKVIYDIVEPLFPVSMEALCNEVS
ncbi:MAG: FAD-dependent thymidylate synthase [Nanoarchaeota archaeon]